MIICASDFIDKYIEAVTTTLGYFWMALWAFVLGYVISSMIQVFVTRKKMRKTMGKNESKGVLLGTLFGFISSSCSFAALATSKSLFKKGAGFVPSLAFLLASTNLVIELGIVISIFLAWQFVVGEYIGGILLILFSWALIKILPSKKLIDKAKEKVGQDGEEDGDNDIDSESVTSLSSWKIVAQKYFMEWKMVWKDVTVGFTLAGIIAAFVPPEFFETMFINTGGGNNDFTFFELLEHTVVGPVAAFCTFIGSMGNIPLASLLYSNGVSFAGVMAFIFSDLVVFPVLRINARYYGWKMALFILFLLFCSLIVASIGLQYGMEIFNVLPEAHSGGKKEQEFFKIDYTFWLNIVFLIISGLFAYWSFFKNDKEKSAHGGEMADEGKTGVILKYIAYISYAWIAIGLVLKFINM